ncbi:acetylornithine aminotransferase apoenzyme /N2-acetyl-L-lysine aminotransferase apoenzyme [Halovenus aranensis]|jgi:acetylornithine/LysW-gamma-L-lysine aminotransferase|uniref:Putative [LysW]-aminoadipate semialdehyde/glutamate semialdehyde transaminase n=1 Tax=Halovenus aranensis TaxID=890420 RepID=A0A1G8WIS7_9EURY|nr:aspartate aminotransferase family protein [Halovenus aranensis]SDJ78027.1 acetylornithine aminotransferase apoenzyme /N2-acetyl-L-lysine aminotransferase apoenzyme [Halovenus aranensis]
MSGFTYSQKSMEIAGGEGVYLTDSEGVEYLDFGANYACTPLGHDHETVQSAVADQLDDLTFVQAVYPVETRQRLHETLAAAAPADLDNVWVCNSGTEANEAALKFARSATGNTKFVAATHAFHGRTMGSLSLTWKDKYRSHYEPLLDETEFVPYNDSEALSEAVDDDTAAVILEPIQGAGGINPATVEFLQTAREATEEMGAALVFDEVQTGLGRTGRMWNHERADIVPDIVTSAKGLANGLPIGATLCRDWIAAAYGNHASTFGGSPVVAAAAEATLSTIHDERLPAHAGEMGTYLRERLERELGDSVRDVRGEGLMVGVEIEESAADAVAALAHDEHVLALTAGKHVVRFLPPLVVDEGHVDRAANALAAVLRKE